MKKSSPVDSKTSIPKIWLPLQYYSGTKDLLCQYLANDNILEHDSIKFKSQSNNPTVITNLQQEAHDLFVYHLTPYDIIKNIGIDVSSKAKIDPQAISLAREHYTKQAEDPDNKNKSLNYLYLAILAPSEKSHEYLEMVLSTSPNFSDLEKIGDLLLRNKKYEKAKELYLQAVEKILSNNEKNDKALGLLFNKLSTASWLNQELEETINYLNNSLQMIDAQTGCEYLTAKVLEKLGSVLAKQRNYKESKEHLDKALALKKQLFQEDHPEVALTYHLIAIMQDNSGLYLKSYDNYHKAKAIYEKTLETMEWHFVTELLDDLGVMARNLGRFKEALDTALLSLEYKKKLYRDEENLDIACSYNHIGNVFIKIDNFEEAINYHEKAFKLRNDLLPKDSPELAESSTQIGLTYRIQQKNEKSLTFLKESLAIREKIFGIDHLDTAESLSHLGTVETSLNNPQSGIANLIRGMDIRRKILGNSHPHYAKSLQSLAVAKVFTSKLDEALELYEKSLELKLEIYHYECLEIAEIFHGLAGIYFLKGNSEEAVNYLSNTVEIRKAVFHPIDPMTKQLEMTMNLYKNAIEQNKKS